MQRTNPCPPLGVPHVTHMGARQPFSFMLCAVALWVPSACTAFPELLRVSETQGRHLAQPHADVTRRPSPVPSCTEDPEAASLSKVPATV